MSKRNLKKLRKENESLKEMCARKMAPSTDPILDAILQMESYLKRHYDFRFNRMNEITEYRTHGTLPFAPLSQRDLNSICIAVRKAGINCWDKDVNRFIYSTQTGSYHPFLLYMQELPLWDGTDRLTDLAQRVSTDDYWIRSFHRWMLAMVAQWMGLDNTHANSVAPILVSRKQGKQKSTYIKMLVPPELQNYYTDDFNLNSKGQATRKLSEYGLICMDEFDKETTKKMPLLKNLMQMASLSFIKSYQKSFSKLPRIASFAGTSNRKDILTDPSGSRRVICIEVTGNIDTTQPIDYEQLYAQAMHEIHHGERYWFDSEDEQIMTENNREFEQTPAMLQLFYQYFKAAQTKEEGEFLTPVEILNYLKKKSGISLSDNKVYHFGRLLQKCGIPSKHTYKGTVYQVIKVL